MIEKSYNVTVGAVLHNLRVLCDGYEGVIAGENFQCRAADAAVTVKAAAALISQLPRWIPVAERLPDVDCTVWVYIPYIRQCEATRRECESSLRGRAHFDGKDYWFWADDVGSEMMDAMPTHWMPLPTPPSGGDP